MASSSPTLATIDLFTVSIVLPFPESHGVGTIQYVAFSHWFPLLGDILLRFLPAFSWVESPFLFSAE